MRSLILACLLGFLTFGLLSQNTEADWAGPMTTGQWRPDLASAGVYSHLGFISGYGLSLRNSNCPSFVGVAPTEGVADSADTSNVQKEGWLKRGGRIAGSILWRIALYLALLVGLVMIPLGLGGTFIMVGAAALFGALTGFQVIGIRLLVVLLGLALVGEGIESLLGVAMARKYGASKWGMWGAFLGGIFGAVVGSPVPVVGNLVAALIGVFVGAFLFEWLGRGLTDTSLKAGWGALLGRAAASAIKLALGMVILILVVARTLS